MGTKSSKTARAGGRPGAAGRPRARGETAAFGQWLVASAQAAAKEGSFIGFGATQVSKGEKEMLDQVRAAVSQA
jgi:hypothetical protein